LKDHYVKYGIKEKRKYKFYLQTNFDQNIYIFKLPNDFEPFIYRDLHNDLKDLNEEQLKNHYIHCGIKEKRIYKSLILLNNNIVKNRLKNFNNINNYSYNIKSLDIKDIEEL